MIKLFLVTDEQPVNSTWKSHLTALSEISIEGEVSNGAIALEQIKVIKPHIVLFDADIPVIGTEDFCRMSRYMNPTVPILVMVIKMDETHMVNTISAGAAGYLFKNCCFDEFTLAIRRVAEKQCYISTDVTLRLLDRYKKIQLNVKPANGQVSLSNREREILQLIITGHTNSEIADTLSISKRTVEFHRNSLLEKTQTKNTATLISYALLNHLANPE